MARRENLASPQRFDGSRRELLRKMRSIAAGLPLAPVAPLAAHAEPSQNGSQHSDPAAQPEQGSLTPADDQLLDEIERASFLFFWEQSNPATGLIKDRCNVLVKDNSLSASIASTGFGLTAICIADQRGYVSRADARLRVIQALSYLWHKLPTHRGFYYHFANINTGERMWDSEVSSVDTALLLCGVLTCREHFKDKTISDLAHAIFDRVDWTWLSEDTSLLPHGWTPEFGFLPYKWDFYSELMMMYLLGMGSQSHPLHSEAWFAWKRTVFEYDGLRYIGSFAPLFVHQYS
ncbi:MAG TPA: glucoamylase family protein, partial [Terracidiphilus sp.]|nr:glucoamylase family protein [Terracidiphilus sp.]